MYNRFGYPVFFGHNFNDSVENVITNIIKTRSINNLIGMESVTYDENIFVRPMLSISKDEIYQFAADNRVPHLPRSTPPTCDRGKIRDIVIPQMNDFHPNFINGLVEMAKITKSVYAVMDTYATEFKKRIQFSENGFYIDLNIGTSTVPLDCYAFWNSVMHHCVTTLSLEHYTVKSMKSFIERLEFKRYGVIRLNSTVSVIYRNNSISLNWERVQKPKVPEVVELKLTPYPEKRELMFTFIDAFTINAYVLIIGICLGIVYRSSSLHLN
jgi:hypothetical protein